MFASSTVSNVFIVAEVMYVYVCVVMCTSRTVIQKLHGVFAMFLWRSPWERTSRTNLFRSLKAGDLGLVYLFLRQVVSKFLRSRPK